MNLIIKAAQFAKYAHEGQVRKYTGRPYVEHPMRVAGEVSMLDGPSDHSRKGQHSRLTPHEHDTSHSCGMCPCACKHIPDPELYET